MDGFDGGGPDGFFFFKDGVGIKPVNLLCVAGLAAAMVSLVTVGGLNGAVGWA